jgi:hypothetical protein
VPDTGLIADMNISPLTIEELRGAGWKIDRVSEVMDVRSKDNERKMPVEEESICCRYRDDF